MRIFLELISYKKGKKKRMSNTLSVKVSSRKTATSEWYEGTVSIAGLRPTKLARRADGSTQFPTKSALSGAARNLAKSLGYSDVEVNDGSKPAQKPQAQSQKKVAAKKSPVKAKASKPSTKKAATVKSATTTN